MAKHFPVIVEQDSEGTFIVECPLYRGCRSYGHSIEEAMANIREAIEACSEDEPQRPESLTFIGIRDLELAAP
jgi:predicted RNase H-like HicB family nuclease